VPRDIADLDIVQALRTNPRRLAAGDMRNLLKEAADEIERLRVLTGEGIEEQERA
jgi:hypothetical protein